MCLCVRERKAPIYHLARGTKPLITPSFRDLGAVPSPSPPHGRSPRHPPLPWHCTHPFAALGSRPPTQAGSVSELVRPPTTRSEALPPNLDAALSLLDNGGTRLDGGGLLRVRTWGKRDIELDSLR